MIHGVDVLLGLGRDEEAWIFDRADAQPWNPGAFSVASMRFVVRSGVQKLRFHDLRHSHATLALAAGTDLKTISAALGHSVSVTANTYLHVVEALQTEHASRIDGMLRGALAEAASRSSGPQRAHKPTSITKKARNNELSMVAPTGIEPE
ncbi:MAG TPA: tyrosine-type recombinase/integrase [Candidatus Baltobacteraceae bacterium]